MPFMPFNILGLWFRGLLSVAILAGGIYLLERWYERSHVVVIVRDAAPVANRDLAREDRTEVGRRIFRFDPGWNRETALLAGGLSLLAWAVAGRWIGNGLFKLTLREGTPGPDPSFLAKPSTDGRPGEGKKAKQRRNRRLSGRDAGSNPQIRPTKLESDEDPTSERYGEVHKLRRPDGSVLHVECYGPADATPVIFTHGWGANSTEWFYPKRYMADRFRLILWDEPGLGLSKKPENNDYRMEKLAADLEAVLAFAGNKPAILVGHSIGGMITLTLCKLFPEALRTRVAGLVLVHTTYTNPVRTTSMGWLYSALEKPVLIPLLYLTIITWPLAWLMNWLSYANGTAHRSTHRSSFSGNETRGQLDFVSRFMPRARPDVLARGMLGMIGYDATNVLGGINVPTLVVVGDKDTTTPPEAGEFIRDKVPGARLETLSPARHMGLIEHHERFDNLLSAFTDSCTTSMPASR